MAFCIGSNASLSNAQTANQRTANQPTAGRSIAVQPAATVAARQVAQPQPGANAQAGNPQAPNADATVADPNARPFKALTAAEQTRLDAMLKAWEQQSKGTKTMSCKFQKWHFDLLAAPAGIHATKSTGVIKYAAPDKGMFKEETIVFYEGMKQGAPQFAAQPGKVGDYWVCNGAEVIEFDGNEKKCTISTLPPGMKGQDIFNSPLPFVFNLDAQKIQSRYWVREVKAPKPGIYLIEAWPKFQADRSQYKMVQIALDDKKFLPTALIMYAPNFNAQNAPMWDHYEFENVGRNAITAGMKQFFNNFIPQRPPSDWQVVREKLPVAGQPNGAPARQAAAADERPATR
ncbi:TIGR03009 domain-containing protein [Planctomycetes bacterium K23_9]